MLKPPLPRPDQARPAQANTCGQEARALYLGAQGKKHVSCTDEALVIRNDQAQTQRFPIVRLVRIVSSPSVDWTGPALALCLRHGIGVTWVDAQGMALGTCYPQQPRHQDSATAIALWLENPNGPEHYAQWLRSRRMDTLLRWGQQQLRTLSPMTWENTKREWVYGARHHPHLPTPLRAQVLAFVAAQLAAQGIPPIQWGPQAQAINVGEDLCELLWVEMNLHTGTLTDTTHTEKSLIQLFESWANRHGAAAALLHLHSLQRCARKAL